MPLGRANLLLDQIEVVQQPFSGRRHPAVGFNRLQQQIADFDEHAFILCQARQELVRRVSGTHPMRTRQGLAVLLHLVVAEQFRSQRRLVAAVLLCRAFSVEACHGIQQVPENRLAHLQAGLLFKSEPCLLA